jgi:hypothetical protein
MDRSYLAPHKVNVYADQQAKDAGNKLKRVREVPYSIHGYASYRVDDKILPGYLDPNDATADACVILKETP